MNKIELILAGAGTGKTTRLAAVLEEALDGGHVRPEAVLATTFTRQAAAELTERARTRLLSAGRHEDAHRLQAARIGTVNAVCGQLVEEFAFELGLSPDVRIIDEPAANRALREALSSVATREESQHLARLTARMEKLEWHVAVAQVVAAARANGVAAAQLDASRERSLELARDVLGTRRDDGEAIDAALISTMRVLVDAIPPGASKGSDDARDRCRRAIVAMESGRWLPWREWGSLSALNANKPYAFVAEPVQRAAAAHDDHPRFHDDVTAAIDLVFTLAARTLDAYEAQKRRWGVIDFVDQEAYALALLRRRDVADRLAEDLDLVMVDEFQDTSPLQLAIFLELAQIAPRSVWVGDQKQSIYGFRGTDPELMDAALELLERRDPAFVDDTLAALFEQTTPTTLESSWRSRPGLVDLTSELFAAAFEPHGIPPDRVKLRPGLTTELPDLGPIVEVWDLQIPNATHTTLYPTTLPSALEALLDDETNVRDRVTGETRRVRLSDIAVLSRRHATSQRVASALEGRGHRVVLPRPGLLQTAEGRLALAALRRWAAPHDALAAAEIDRMTRYADAPDAWLHSLAVRDETPEVCPAVAAIDSARAIDPDADPLTAVERCMAEVGLRELCPRWGEARQRLGNLDALRSAALSYVAARASERGVASVAGLLAHFELLAEEEADVQAVLAGDEAVTLCTWHAAKGLEWPITILFDLDWSPPGGVTGVEVEPGRPRLDLRDPLADRWIRYLPQPFLWNQRKVPFIARAERMEFAQRANERHEREQLRLLYVAWTRARDRLVLAGPAGKMYGKILASLRDRNGPLLSPPRREGAVWGGCRVEVLVRSASPVERRRRSTEPGHAYEARTPRVFPPAWLNPSAIAVPGVAVDVVEIGAPFVVTGVDPQALGEALHAFFAADDRTHVAERRVAFAAEQLQRWGVTCPGLELHLVTAADALAGFIGTRWPGASVRREVPVWHGLPNGTILHGSADVVIELANAYAVIDHKAILGSVDRAVLDAVEYAGQLSAYADAIAAASPSAMVNSFVHLPLAGRIIELSGDRPTASG